MRFIDVGTLGCHLTDVCDHYERSAPPVQRWADDLFQRLFSDAVVDLREVLFAERLLDDGAWMHPNTAQNQLYKLLTRLGRDTSGMIDH